MSENYRIYEYNFAGYYTGNYRDIPNDQGYPAGPWTDVPVPSIPAGQFAVFDGQGWFLTSEPEPAPPDPTPVPEPIKQISDPPTVV